MVEIDADADADADAEADADADADGDEADAEAELLEAVDAAEFKAVCPFSSANVTCEHTVHETVQAVFG